MQITDYLFDLPYPISDLPSVKQHISHIKDSEVFKYFPQMRTTRLDLGSASCQITYDHESAPIHVAISPSGTGLASFGALAYATPGYKGQSPLATVLIPFGDFGDHAKLLASTIATRFQRPTFINMSVDSNTIAGPELSDLINDMLTPGYDNGIVDLPEQASALNAAAN